MADVMLQELERVRARLAEVEQREAALREALNVLVPVAELYLGAFGDDQRVTLGEALRLTEVRDTLAALAQESDTTSRVAGSSGG